MTIKTPSRSALRIPYLAVRTPLSLLDEQIVVRMFGVDSSAHRSLAHGLNSLDAFAASTFATGNAARTRPADAAVDSDAPGRGDVNTATEPVDRAGGEQPIDLVEQQQIAQLADTFLAEDELAPRSGELAENEELRRVQAQIRAKQEIETEHGQL